MKRWPLVGAAICLSLQVAAQAEDWPKDSAVHEKSASPDGQYGIVLPGNEEAAEGENYLANLKTHQLLGEIKGADYFEGENHRGLNVIWAPDSTACVVEYEARFGFDMIALLQLNGSGFTQTDLGKQIEKSLVSVTHEEGQASAFFRFAPGKLLVRALYYTGNPKMIEKDSKQARFAGTFDLKSKKWTNAQAWKIKDWDALSSAYGTDAKIFVGDVAKAPEDFVGRIVASEEEKADALDESMNAVYQGLRIVLPPARFARVQQEQKTWLKKRDAAAATEQCRLLEERIAALEALLW